MSHLLTRCDIIKSHIPMSMHCHLINSVVVRSLVTNSITSKISSHKYLLQSSSSSFSSLSSPSLRILLTNHRRCNGVAVASYSTSSTSSSSQHSSSSTSSSARYVLASVAAAAASFLLFHSTVECETSATAVTSLSPSRRLPATATPAERVAVSQLRESLVRAIEISNALSPSIASSSSAFLTPSLVSYITTWALPSDVCLLRYLRAHKLNITNAQVGLISTALWRMQHEVDGIRANEFEKIYQQGLMYVSSSTDRFGRALIINRKSPNPSVGWNEQTYRTELRSLVYTMERAIREMDERLDREEYTPETLDTKWIFLVDMRSYTSTSATPWKVTKSFIDLMRLHYPERLSTAVILDAPWILTSLLKLLRPVIPKVTREKIYFINDRNSDESLRVLRKAIGSEDLKILPKESGIEGAQTVYDVKIYIDRDPLARSSMEAKAADETKATSRFAFWK